MNGRNTFFMHSNCIRTSILDRLVLSWANSDHEKTMKDNFDGVQQTSVNIATLI